MQMRPTSYVSVLFFNDTATTEIYTLSLHDALPIWGGSSASRCAGSRTPSSRGSAWPTWRPSAPPASRSTARGRRSSEIGKHTSELQSRQYLVCRLLLEKKKTSQAAVAFYFLLSFTS